MTATTNRSTITDRLRRLADRTESAWRLQADDRVRRCRAANQCAIEAGGLILELYEAGSLSPDDHDVHETIELANTRTNDQARRVTAFCHLVQLRWSKWNPHLKYSAACSRDGVGPVWADAMRWLAEEIAEVDEAGIWCNAAWYSKVTDSMLYPDLLGRAGREGRVSMRKLGGRNQFELTSVCDAYDTYRNVLMAATKAKQGTNQHKPTRISL